MANDAHNPDAEAKKWFALALIGCFLYVSTVFLFVITADPGGPKQVPAANPAGAEVQHGQSH